MSEFSGEPLSREEKELLNYFRGLPLDQQLDILGAAEASFNANERMKELASREVETRLEDVAGERRWH